MLMEAFWTIVILANIGLVVFIVSLLKRPKDDGVSKATNMRNSRHRWDRSQQNDTVGDEYYDEEDDDDEEMVKTIIDEDYYYYNEERNCNDSY